MKVQEPGPAKKRRRVFVVCAECRERKIRCDRKCPCAHCKKSGLKCEYTAPDGSPLEEASSSEMEKTVTRTVSSLIGSQLSDIVSGMTQIRERLAVVERHVQNTPSSTASGTYSSVLDVKSPNLKLSTIVTKPSRTLFLGPSSRFWLVFSRPVFVSLFSGLRDIINKEKSAWKALHPVSTSHGIGLLLDERSNEDIVAEMVENIVCPYYRAFEERLVHFENNLNSLLFDGLVPMHLIHSLFVSYFTVSDDGVAHFNRPKKSYRYADVSAIIAIAYTVLIFTRHSEVLFQYQLPMSADDLSSLSLRLLNVSQFLRKKTHMALLSLVILRASLFVFDNADRATQELDSYPMLQMCLDLCYQMGIHADEDTTRTFVIKDEEALRGRSLSFPEVKVLWNYMQLEDASSSLTVGTPLLINYEFSAEFCRSSDLFFDRKREEGLLLMRESSLLLNSRKDVSMRDILNMYTKVLSFCNQFPARMFSPGGSYENLDELAYLFKQKLLLVQVLQSMCGMIIAEVSRLQRSHSPALDYQETVLELGNLSKEMNRQVLVSGAVLLYQIKYVFAGKSIFGTDKNGKYMVFFRDIFCRSSAQAFITWFTFVLPRATKSSELVREFQTQTLLLDYPPEENGYVADINLSVLEKALFHEFRGEDGQLGERLSTRLISSQELMAFASSFYDSVCQNEIMRSSLDCFLTLKSVIIWLYIVRTVEEYRPLLDSKQMTVPDIIKNARAKVENDFITGGLDDRKLVTERYDLDKLFDSLFVEQDWLNLPDLDPGSLFVNASDSIARVENSPNEDNQTL